MKIRVLQGFAGYEPGQVFEDWPDGMCEIFIARGVIERVESPRGDSTSLEHEVNRVAVESADESAEATQEVERAQMPGRRKRK